MRVARAAADAQVPDDAVTRWLSHVPIEQWAELFGARPSDVLDLLDAISDPQAEILRRLLDGEEIELDLDEDLAPGPVKLVVSQDATEAPLVSLRTVGGDYVATLAGRWQTDLRTVLATGVDIRAD